jgi:hypothetical protein
MLPPAEDQLIQQAQYQILEVVGEQILFAISQIESDDVFDKLIALAGWCRS